MPSAKNCIAPTVEADHLTGKSGQQWMPLSDSAVRVLKPEDKRYKKSDQRGLYIGVEPNGAKLWRWKYRYRGGEKRIALRRYPDVSLAAARRLQEDARRLLKAGGPICRPTS